MQAKSFVDFSFRVKDFSLLSPELNTIGYLTPNRNLLRSSISILIFGATTTTSPIKPPSKKIYKNIFIGETKKMEMPILISSKESNYIEVTINSIDIKKQHQKDFFRFEITTPLNKIIRVGL